MAFRLQRVAWACALLQQRACGSARARPRSCVTRGWHFAVLVAGVAAFCTRTVVAGDATSRWIIEYEQNRLTVHTTQVAVADILAELGRQAGAEVRGDLADLGEANIDFESVALPEAVHRLLRRQSFALFYGPAGQLRAITVLRGSDSTRAGGVSVATSEAPAAVPPATDTQDPAARWSEFTARPVHVSGKLAAALGTDIAPMRDILNTMIRNDDPAVRGDALSASMRLLAYDSEMRTALLGLWPVLDPDMTRYRTVSGGPSWRRLLAATARHAL